MPELIQLPALVSPEGSARVTVHEGTVQLGMPTSLAARFKWYARGRHTLPTIDSEIPVLDLRFDGGQNLAHAFCWIGLHALIAQRALREERGDEALMVVVPGNAKSFVVRALELLGFTPVSTFAPVRGEIVTVTEYGHHILLRMADQLLPPSLGTLLREGPTTPEKLFISRRDVRCVENEAEIMAVLEERGFKKIYAEDLPVLEQVRYLTNAAQVVAIHGAALGPLVCRNLINHRRPLRLLELFGSGYIVTLYREIVSDLGDSWIAVRGRVTSEVVRDVDSAGLARAHEKSNFIIDPEALRIALDASEQDVNPQCTVTW